MCNTRTHYYFAVMLQLLQVMACTRGVSVLSSSSSGLGGRGLVSSLLCSRLLHSLLSSILEFRRGEGDLLVLNMKHSVIRKVVQERYLENEEKRLQVFDHLSGYFSGKLQGGSQIEEESQGDGPGEQQQEVAECADPFGGFMMRVGVGVGLGLGVRLGVGVGVGVGVVHVWGNFLYTVCVKSTPISFLYHICRRWRQLLLFSCSGQSSRCWGKSLFMAATVSGSLLSAQPQEASRAASCTSAAGKG